MDITVENLKEEHSKEVLEIYQDGIRTGDASFETTAPTWKEWDQTHLPECRLVAVGSRGDVLGWAALSPVSGRCVYAGVTEASVYVKEAVRGLGVGRALLEALVEESEVAGIWTLEAGTFPENKFSIALLKSCGFRQIGYRERLGKLEGIWRDVILFERRSKVAGV
jgi:phosphinothricin acetyltransferase